MKEEIKIFSMTVVVITILCAAFSAGYYKRGEDISQRLNSSEESDEGCFSREEVAYFIYGE